MKNLLLMILPVFFASTSAFADASSLKEMAHLKLTLNQDIVLSSKMHTDWLGRKFSVGNEAMIYFLKGDLISDDPIHFYAPNRTYCSLYVLVDKSVSVIPKGTVIDLTSTPGMVTTSNLSLVTTAKWAAKLPVASLDTIDGAYFGTPVFECQAGFKLKSNGGLMLKNIAHAVGEANLEKVE